MMNKIEFDELAEFKRDLKNLLKKYRSLNEDLVIVKMDLSDEPGESPPFSFRIDNLGIETCIIKVKKNCLQSTKRQRRKLRIKINICALSHLPKNYINRIISQKR